MSSAVKSKRILLVANAGNKYEAQRFYNPDRRILNGLIRNGHDVWFFSDRDEAQRGSLLRAVGKKRTNQRLLNVIANYQPHAILLVNANIITPETLAEIKAKYPNTPIAQIIVDPMFMNASRQFWQARLDMVDMHFFNTGGEELKDFSKYGRPCYFIPNMTDVGMDTGRAFEIAQPRYDVSCIMRPANGREQLPLHLERVIPNLKTCYHGFGGRPKVAGASYLDIFGQSALALNVSQYYTEEGVLSTPQSRHLFSGDRIAHLMGNGSLAFLMDNANLDQIYSTEEVVFFHEAEDLTEKVKYYLANPAERQRIAHNGWKKAHGAFSERRIMQYILERLLEAPLSESYEWPTEAMIA